MVSSVVSDVLELDEASELVVSDVVSESSLPGPTWPLVLPSLSLLACAVEVSSGSVVAPVPVVVLVPELVDVELVV